MQLSQPDKALLQEAANLCGRLIPSSIQKTAPKKLTTTFHQALMELIEGRPDSDKIRLLIENTEVSVPIAFEKYLLATDGPPEPITNLAIVTSITDENPAPILTIIANSDMDIQIPNVSDSLWMNRLLQTIHVKCERGDTLFHSESGPKSDSGTFEINTRDFTEAIYTGNLTATFNPQNRTIDFQPLQSKRFTQARSI